MRKEDKNAIIAQLAETINEYGHFYLIDATAMNAAASNDNGAMMGFMGMGMAQQQGANVLNTAMGVQQQPQAGEAPVQPAPGQAFAGVVQTPEAPKAEETQE